MLKKLKNKPRDGDLVMPGSFKIFYEDIGKTFMLRNGQKYYSLTVREGMEGHLFSEFFMTKLRGSQIHVKKVKKGKKK